MSLRWKVAFNDARTSTTFSIGGLKRTRLGRQFKAMFRRLIQIRQTYDPA